MVDEQLMQEYQEAAYQVKLPNGLWGRIYIGQDAKWVTVQSIALIFAYNPYSEVLSEVENSKRQSQLLKLVQDQQYNYDVCRGGAASLLDQSVPANPKLANPWAWEYGVAIYDISQEQAIELGRQFQQNAIVFADALESLEIVDCLA